MISFCHLHVHTQFSFLDGFGSAKKYAERARDLNFKFLACTDHGGVDGLIKFQGACSEIGIKPIFGCEAYIVPDAQVKKKNEKRKHIVLLVKNKKGWQNLLQMLTYANLKGFYHRPRIDPNVLLEHLEGLVVLTGCTSSFIMAEWGEQLFSQIYDILGDDLYLELMPHLMKEQVEVNKKCCELSIKFDCNLVASNDCHYVNAEDSKAQEVLLAIQKRQKWKDPDRFKFSIIGLYLRTAEEMVEAFKEQGCLPEKVYIDALRQTIEVAEKCADFKIEKLKVHLPKVPGYKDRDEKELLAELCREGVEKKIIGKVGNMRAYRKRYAEEYNAITGLGFTRYFLIVWELIDWCKKNDIFTGPGRGSVGSSLIAYLLGITAVDPLKFDLIFSRFISPARIDLPDIDMDFEDVKRDRVRQHLEELYGKDNVAGVSTFLTMKGKAAVRDVSRVFDVPIVDVNAAANSIVVRSGGDFRASFTIEDAFGVFEDGKRFKKKYPEVSEVAVKMEGQVRGSGLHAAALVISAESLMNGERANICLRKNKSEVINWDKYDVEHVGLMKLDILGLNALTVLNETCKVVKENHGIDIDYESLPLDDGKVFEQFTLGNNVGCFQVGSLGLIKYCRDLGIDNFDMLVAANALYRPGTLRTGMANEFILRKRGEKTWDSIHPYLEKLTAETYGIILYQEQVMRLMYELGGLGWRTADTVRKVISKSQGVEQFRKFKDQFVEGCKKRDTLDPKSAGDLWEQLASFGCLTGDTIIYRVSSNQHVGIELKLKDAYYYQQNSNFKHRKLKILSMHYDGQIRYNTIKAIYSTGKKEVYYFRTNSNKSIKATIDHKFLTIDGWAELENIKAGDWIRTTNLELPKKVHGDGYGSGPHGLPSPIKRKGLGKTNDEARQKQKLVALYDDKCQICGSDYFVEMHHADGNHENNTDENTMLLCRKHHKQQYDRSIYKRFRYGYYTAYEQVVEKKSIGIRETYDVEMEEEPANFVANSFICHNSYSFNKSHSVSYSLIAYWDQYMKVYHPSEFISCSLTYGSEGKREDLVEEAKRIGLKIMLPKVEISDISKWKAVEDKLYMPFLEIKGIGGKKAEKLQKAIADGKYESIEPSMQKLLVKIKAFDSEELSEEELEGVEDLFSYDVSKDPMKKYRGIYDRLSKEISFRIVSDVDFQNPDKSSYYYFGQMTETKFGYRGKIDTLEKKLDISGLADALGGVYGNFKDDSDFCMLVFDGSVYKKKKDLVEHSSGEWLVCYCTQPGKTNSILCKDAWIGLELLEGRLDGLNLKLMEPCAARVQVPVCEACELRQQCRAPVPCTQGQYNIMIIGEAPGQTEDREGIPFTGKAGKLLWQLLSKIELNREMFYVSNVIKCFPSVTKTPTAKHVKACSHWLKEEIEAVKPFLILAFGNTCMRFFKGKDSGIMEMNGKTEWSPEYNAWICWSIHPAAVLYHEENMPLLKEGLNNFSEKLEVLGGF